MRLLRLEMKGFGAFRGVTELDFEDAEFFALVGPTGSGKSTVLDAVCFALYGSVPRYDDEKLISPVLTLGASEAKVRLDFELGGDHYIATRVARRTPKGATTKEARLERVTSGDDTDALASGGPEVSGEVRRLLGLRFEDFTRCVALPQGDFARFLRGKVDERRDLMLRLLNLGVYRDVGERARREADEARIGIESYERQLADLEGATSEALEAARLHRDAVEAVRDEVERAQPALAGLAETEQEARRRAAEARARAERLDAVAVPEEVRQFARRHQEATERAEAAARTAAELGARREALGQERAELPELGVLQAVRKAHADQDECDRRIAAAESRLAELRAAEAGLRAEVDEARESLQRRHDERRALERRHQAAALSETLLVGEPCPVCERVVDQAPRRPAVPALAGADEDVAAAEAALDQQRSRYQEVTNRLAAGAEKLDVLYGRRKELALATESHPDAGPLDALLERVTALESALRRVREEERTARHEAQQAEAALGGLKDGMQQARTRLAAQRDTVAALGPPPGAGDDVLADWTALARWAGEQVGPQRHAAGAADAEAEGCHRSREETLQRLREELRQLLVPVAADADPMAIMKAVVEAATGAATAVRRVEEDMARAAALREERGRLEEERAVAKLLGDLMRADGFPQWLVGEALEILTVDASEILTELTGGQFSLAVGEKEFVVVDHANADERRPARTLSGGETFQASLALALALSRQIRNLAAEGAPRLDAIFLDEGFGTLDPETLEVVAATIENLGRSGRMVGIVTHVTELAGRVPVRFRVAKGPGTSVVEKEYA